MCLAVNKGNILVNFLLLKIFIITYKSSCVSCLTIFLLVEALELCQKCDFFPEKGMKEIFAYILEFMLTFHKMQNTSPLMCTKFEI